MTYCELEDEEIVLIAGFDINGRIRRVIDKEADGKAIIVDDKFFKELPPKDTFKGGPTAPLILRKIEPFQVIVYEYPSVNAAGRRRRSIHVQGNLIPHP